MYAKTMNPELLFVALFAARGAFFALGVATLAVLMSPILAKAFDLAGGFFMAFLAVADSGDVSLVVEFNPFFQLDDLRSGKGRARKRNQGKQCNNSIFHFYSSIKNIKSVTKLLHGKKGCQAKSP
jgi:hypothetical protein